MSKITNDLNLVCLAQDDLYLYPYYGNSVRQRVNNTTLRKKAQLLLTKSATLAQMSPCLCL